MNRVSRFEVYPNQNQPSSMNHNEQSICMWFKENSLDKLKSVYKIPVYRVKFSHDNHASDLHKMACELLADEIVETLVDENTKDELSVFAKSRSLDHFVALEVNYKPGVTDNTAMAVMDAFHLLQPFKNQSLHVASGYLYFFNFDSAQDLSLLNQALIKLSYERLANELLHDVEVISQADFLSFKRFQNLQWPDVKSVPQKVQEYNLNISDAELLKLNQANCWALSLSELHQIRDEYIKLKRNPTDVEIEILAQSWSEHCKHKIFQAEIDYIEENLPAIAKPIGSKKVKSLFKTYIRGATEKIKQERNLSWLISVFHDNAGIVRFDKNLDVCIKVETHNSPSALDPYGGALTGILGVNRDILGCGQGAKPIGNTNVFCLAENEYFQNHKIEIPKKLKNPDRIAEGVHLGVQDGGNKSGIPTINGAFSYHPQFVGKPLVYCGTIGVLPHTEHQLSTAEKRHKPGDLVVMSGGRIGKDGIHGATFSSMELNDSIPASVVQIGDPITQKRLLDFLLEARQLNLFSSVTDNGAGGLSSSVGEMSAHTHGAELDLEKAPTKYPGLSPFEIMVSESQERMTFAVPEEKLPKFLELSQKRNVESTVVGRFNDSGYLTVRYQNQVVANLDLNFLHESLTPMKLKAEFSEKLQNESKKLNWIREVSISQITSHSQGFFVHSLLGSGENLQQQFKNKVLSLLASGNIRSHEHLVRRYDHEVQASTLVKPFTGEKSVGYFGPTDAGVVWLAPQGGEEKNAISVSCGLQPQLSQVDSYLMAVASTDEAVRNLVCVGTDPEQVVLVDNFCWPDPLESQSNPDAHYKLAQLVRTAEALYDISVAYGMPFVSGKDSMKNDFIFEKTKISVLPTVLVSAMGRVPNIDFIKTSEVKTESACVYLLSRNVGKILKDIKHFSEFKFEYQNSDLVMQFKFYKTLFQAIQKNLIESAHDVSDGGLLISLIEKCFSTSKGLKIDFCQTLELNLQTQKLFENLFLSEIPGQIVVSVNANKVSEFETHFNSSDFMKLGVVTLDSQVEIQLLNESLVFRHHETQKSFRVKSQKELEV